MRIRAKVCIDIMFNISLVFTSHHISRWPVRPRDKSTASESWAQSAEEPDLFMGKVSATFLGIVMGNGSEAQIISKLQSF